MGNRRIPIYSGDKIIDYIKTKEESTPQVKETKKVETRSSKYAGQYNKGYSVNGKKLGRPSTKEGKEVSVMRTSKKTSSKRVVKRRLKRGIVHKIKLGFATFVMIMTVVGINTTYEWFSSLAITEKAVSQENNLVLNTEEVVSASTEVEEVKAVETPVERKNYACSTSSVKSYMDYRAITNTSSRQYKYIKQYMTVGDDGYLRDKDGNIGIALGSHFGEIGSKYEVVLDTGRTFRVVKIEEKADRHVNNGCEHKQDHSVIEFVVDSSKMPKASNGYVYSGNFNNVEQFKGYIQAMYKID